MTTFSEFMQTRAVAAEAYSQGRAGEVIALSTAREPASFFGPDGKSVRGVDAVRDDYRAAAERFGPNGSNAFKIVHMAEGGDVAYWSGLQEAVVESDGKPLPMTLRITELFRREGGSWKLVHRHADFLKSGA